MLRSVEDQARRQLGSTPRKTGRVTYEVDGSQIRIQWSGDEGTWWFGIPVQDFLKKRPTIVFVCSDPRNTFVTPWKVVSQHVKRIRKAKGSWKVHIRRENGRFELRDYDHHTDLSPYLRGWAILRKKSRGAGSLRRVTQSLDEVLSIVQSPKGSGQGFKVDPQVRRTIDKYAMRRAKLFFRNLGFKVDDVHRNHPFDLRCIKGAQELHVEVKGTQTTGEKVLLTPGEVKHARENADKAALYILRKVRVSKRGQTVKAFGGKGKLRQPWKIDEGTLDPLLFEYRLDGKSRRVLVMVSRDSTIERIEARF
jgi:hypothetical protein